MWKWEAKTEKKALQAPRVGTHSNFLNWKKERIRSLQTIFGASGGKKIKFDKKIYFFDLNCDPKFLQPKSADYSLGRLGSGCA